MMMNRLKLLLAEACSSQLAQRLLELNVSASHALMGIGSTGALESHADSAVLKRFAGSLGASRRAVLFDVGANIGQYGGLIREQLVGREFAVHSFEPSFAAFQKLAQALSSDARFVLNDVGLGEKEEILELFSDAPDSGCASLTRPSYGREFDYSQKVRIITLDGYCAKRGIERIDWLKIDVEGHELGVLKGAREMFRQNRIDNVYFEFGFPAVETRVFVRDYFEFFEGYGMELNRVTMAGTLVPLKKYRCSLEQFRASSALFARRPAR